VEVILSSGKFISVVFLKVTYLLAKSENFILRENPFFRSWTVSKTPLLLT
jgi:hypothetical protein